MNNKEYDKLVKSVVGKESTLKNVMIAFISGGLVGVIAQMMSEFYFKVFDISLSDASFYTFSTFIFIGSFLTGLGVFDKVLSVVKCGLIVPSIFKLTGSIILYGIIFGIIFGFIRGVIM